MSKEELPKEKILEKKFSTNIDKQDFLFALMQVSPALVLLLLAGLIGLLKWILKS